MIIQIVLRALMVYFSTVDVARLTSKLIYGRDMLPSS